MKATYLAKSGGPLVFGNLPDPSVTLETARVKVLYCGVNHLDVLIRQGKRPGIPKFPHILGSEVVGTIEEVNGTTETFSAGDTVAVYPWTFCGTCLQCITGNEQICDTGGTFGRTRWGGYAQYLVAPLHNLMKIPKDAAFDEVCALILAGTTARHLVDRSGVGSRQTVLITGATGGVGTIVIQLLKFLECTVIAATSHPEKSQHLKQVGADYVISDRLMMKNIQALSPAGVNAVIDIVGGNTWSGALRTLTKNGTMVFCSTSRDEAGSVPVGMAFTNQWNILGSYGGNKTHMAQILSLYEKGVVKPVIDSVYPLEQARLAHDKITQQKIFGKIILQLPR